MIKSANVAQRALVTGQYLNMHSIKYQERGNIDCKFD